MTILEKALTKLYQQEESLIQQMESYRYDENLLRKTHNKLLSVQLHIRICHLQCEKEEEVA